MSDLLEVHAFPRAVRPRDERHAAAVSDVGVVRDETVDRELLVEFCVGGVRQLSGANDTHHTTRAEHSEYAELTLATVTPSPSIWFVHEKVASPEGEGGSLFTDNHYEHERPCLHAWKSRVW